MRAAVPKVRATPGFPAPAALAASQATGEPAQPSCPPRAAPVLPGPFRPLPARRHHHRRTRAPPRHRRRSTRRCNLRGRWVRASIRPRSGRAWSAPLGRGQVLAGKGRDVALAGRGDPEDDAGPRAAELPAGREVGAAGFDVGDPAGQQSAALLMIQPSAMDLLVVVIIESETEEVIVQQQALEVIGFEHELAPFGRIEILFNPKLTLPADISGGARAVRSRQDARRSWFPGRRACGPGAGSWSSPRHLAVPPA